MLLCQRHSHEVVALANLLPANAGVDELDSFCFQTVGHNVVAAYASCCGLPLYRRRFHGQAKQTGMAYSETKGDEVEDLYLLLKAVKERMPEVQAVSSGAIASDYQRLRVEEVCSRLGLFSLAYMWHQPQAKLLRQMCSAGIHAVLIKVAAIGLDPSKHLGKSLAEMEAHLHSLQRKYDVNVCGEGGEYETLTLDCPLFTHARIKLTDTEVVQESALDPSQGGMLKVRGFELEPKAGAGSVPPPEIIDVADEVGSATIPPGVAPPEAGQVETSVAFVSTAPHFRHLVCSLRLCAPEVDPAGAYDQLFREASEAVAAAGLAWGDALICNLYLRSMDNFGAVNSVYCRYVTKVCPPSRVCVQLELPAGQEVQLDALFAAGEPRPARATLHVQSLSEWAPPCIGPYSQGVALRGLLFMAGQISLNPPSLAIVAGGLRPETRQALRNCEAAAVALSTSMRRGLLSLTCVLSGRTGANAAAAVQEEFEAFIAEAPPRDDDDDEADGEEADETAGEAYLDEYIRPPDMPPPGWRPLLAYAVVPRLPKEALIEFVPFAVSAKEAAMLGALQSADLCHGEGGAWTVQCVRAPRRLLTGRAFLRRTGLEGSGSSTADAADAWAPRLGELAAAVRTSLADADLAPRDMVSMRAMYAREILPSEVARDAVASQLADALHDSGGEAAPTCRPVMVPVERLGHSASDLNDALAVEWLAMAASPPCEEPSSDED